ncbi:MAG: hypothetical protein DMD94_01160 [Candidatus Rokuibacteriota bacterium]|nr:MAG: hypothetical protein DMD94_01160 [Candidatus Rokubacteria bacterium]
MVRGGECTGRRSSITSAEPQPSRRHLLRSLPTFAALQQREFRLLWAGQVATAMAGWMDQVARGWLLYELTDSPVQLGLLQGIRAIPILFASPHLTRIPGRTDPWVKSG